MSELENKYKEFLNVQNIKESFNDFSKAMFIQSLNILPTDKELEEFFVKQPQLNENQQIVLDAFKKEYQYGKYFPLALIHYSVDKGFSKKERGAYVSLSRLQEAEVLQAFTTWMLEQEESE